MKNFNISKNLVQFVLFHFKYETLQPSWPFWAIITRELGVSIFLRTSLVIYSFRVSAAKFRALPVGNRSFVEWNLIFFTQYFLEMRCVNVYWDRLRKRASLSHNYCILHTSNSDEFRIQDTVIFLSQISTFFTILETFFSHIRFTQAFHGFLRHFKILKILYPCFPGPPLRQ